MATGIFVEYVEVIVKHVIELSVFLGLLDGI